MTYIITGPCVGVQDVACLAVCPVDCIIATGSDNLYFINPTECIDCGACVLACPINAVYAEENLPEELRAWIPANYEYFTTERDDFYAKFRELIAGAKERRRDGPWGNTQGYQRD